MIKKNSRVLGELTYVAHDTSQLQTKINNALAALDGEQKNFVSRKKIKICTGIFIDSKLTKEYIMKALL